ncbi:SAC3 family protein B [Apium graveolens]|uniref:SAC3 family protein B n=1 Tax=Apium graveolens TaxID=4045 RepID=UPI003D78C4A0
MSFQGFGKSSGPGAPPSSSNPFASNFPRNSTPTPPPIRPTEPSAKWGDEYPTLNEVYNSQTNQRASVIPSNAVPTAGSLNITKSSQFQDQKRNRSLPSLFPDEGTLRNSTASTGMPHFSTPAWGNKANFPAQFVDSINQHDHLSAPSDFGNYDTGRNSVNKERYVQAPKRTRSPVQYDDLDDFTEDPVTVQTESKRLSTRSTDYSDTPVSQFHEPFVPSGPVYTEVATAKLSNFSAPKRSRSPSSLKSDKSSQGDFNVAEDDTERELQAKAKRMARFKDELSQPEPSSLAIGNQKFPLRVYDQAVLGNQKSKKESLEMSSDNPSANISVEYEGQDSSSIISGLCPEMCPESERAERERKGDLDRYERLDGDRNQSSIYLAVKKYTRTAEREANLIRPMPILQKTMNYLLELLDQPYNDGLLGLYNFLWDRMRAIRMDLRMQHIFNLEAITMLEQMIRLHILAMHELCEYPKGEGFSEGFDAHLNIEQMNKTSVELFQLYDDHRKNGIDVPTEKEFRGYYALLKLDKHPGYKVEPAELSLDLAKMTPEVRQAPDVLFARDVARSCRIGNYIAFFRLLRKASYLQACLMHAHFAKLRTQALASLHSGLQNNQGIPVAHVAQWLGMEDEDIEDLLDYHGFSIKEFGEPYMVKEGPFLNNNDSGTLKCSKLVHLKKSRTMFEDVSSPSLMEPVSSKAVKVISSVKVYEQNHTPVQCNATGNKLVAEEEMDSEPVSSPTKPVPVILAIDQQIVHNHQPISLNPSPVNISPAIYSLKSMDDSTDDAVMPSFKLEFHSFFEKNNHSETKTMPMDIMPIVLDQERLPVLEMDFDADKTVNSAVLVEDLSDADCISTLEDMRNDEGSQSDQDEEVAKAKLILILRKWRRYCSQKRELRKKKQIAANTALSSLSLGPSIRHYEEQQSKSGEFNVHLIMNERHDKHERSWSKVNVSEVVAGRLSERNVNSKCLCWKVVLCSQIDGSDRSIISGLAAGSWLYDKIMPAGDHNDDELITSSTDLSIWKKWISDLSSGEPICCLSIIKDARCDNLEENVAGANAIMFLVYECIPLKLQKQRLYKLVMSLPSGSSVPLLILSGSCKNHSDPSFIAAELGLNEVDNSRVSCFSVVFLLENQNTDGFFSDVLLREGLEWLASSSPKQPVLHSVKTQELVFTHLNPLMEVLDGQIAYTTTPTQCISAFNEALKLSIEEVVAAVDANLSCWPCPEMDLLEKSSDVHRAVNWYLPRVGWSSAAEVAPVISALKQCNLPSFSDDLTWLFSGTGMDHYDIGNQKSRLEDCLTRYLTQTSQMMGFSLAKQEAYVMLQKFARLELHESTYFIVPKWALIFRRIFNWRLMNLLNGEISRTYVLKESDRAVATNKCIIQDEGDVSFHSIIEPSLDEMLQVSCRLRCYPECEASQPVHVLGSNHNEVLNVTKEIEFIEEDRSSLQNNSLGDMDNDGNMNPANRTSSERDVSHVTTEADRLSKLLEKCNVVQNMIDKKLSIYF